MVGAPPYLGEPKTQTSYRTVDMPAIVHRALAAHLASSWLLDMDPNPSGGPVTVAFIDHDQQAS